MFYEARNELFKYHVMIFFLLGVREQIIHTQSEFNERFASYTKGQTRPEERNLLLQFTS